jgi:5-methylcytosine-specific restriction protein A
MTLRPCIDCGEPAEGPRCPEHTTDAKGTATARGYDAAWDKLSKRARRLSPFCSDCGSTEGLECDHSPEAWARKAAGKSIRLQDVDVVCGECNRARGAARGITTTRGDAPHAAHSRPPSRQSLSHSPGEATLRPSSCRVSS